MGKDTIIILLFFMFVVNLQAVQTQNLDIDLLQRVNQRATGFKPISRFLSETTVPLSLSVPVLMGGYSLITSDKELFKDAFYIALASGVNLGATLMLKETIGRERPYDAYPNMLDVYKAQNDFSMPSGHSSGAFATATAVSLKYPKWYIIVPSFAWAGAVAYSRMHLGVHYPSDVLAGAVLGAGSAWISWQFNQWIWGKYDIRGFKIIKR